jgi:signal transduction histidine kinase/DNA-binding NarL/FixJ family response regulator
MVQNIIAYGAGFIAPCFFPFYVYKSFGLEKMRHHAFKGVFLFLIVPFLLFTTLYIYKGDLDVAKNVLGIVLLYAFAVIYSLVKSIRYKYRSISNGKISQEEAIMLLSLTPWATVPIVDFFNMNQAIEALITNFGFLLLLGLQIKESIAKTRAEYELLLTWNTTLKSEVEKRTVELQKVNDQRTTAFINVAHEIKTPLTLINNYLDDYIEQQPQSEQLTRIKKNIEKLNKYIANFFDITKVSNGFTIYNNNQVTNLSELLSQRAFLFQQYACKNNILFNISIEEGIFIKAAPEALDRIINNLLENALKFVDDDGEVTVELQNCNERVLLSVKDNGIGIEPYLEKKIFQPYYQINNPTIKKNQGLGLGLPIVKKIIEELKGEILIKSHAAGLKGTTFLVFFPASTTFEAVRGNEACENKLESFNPDINKLVLTDTDFNENKQTLLIAEDNIEMHSYVFNKLKPKYNIYSVPNGREAIAKIKEVKVLPDLVISDVMMDNLDGFGFISFLANNPRYKHIPVIFLSAKSGTKEKLKGLGLGAIDFIEKPFNIEILIQKIESILVNAKNQKNAFVEFAYNSLKETSSTHLLSEKEDLKADLPEEQSFDYNLTKREKQIAELVSQGYSYKSIGETLFIAETTVTKHVQNIYSKLNVSNKVEMINKLEVK